ncbi:MAG TPA: hypothetical protein VNU01_02845 [Egibacteraceae bacterium]|nr:hypothetical protein [Egibacteraceae bacterium]
MHRFLRLTRAAAIAAALLLMLTACGDDDADSADGGDTVTAYCDYVAELDDGESLPTEEQLDRLEELAPEEIAEEIAVASNGLREQGTNAFGDPDVNKAFDAIESYESEHCPDNGEDGEDGEEDEDEGPVAQEPDPDATRVDVVARDLEFVLPDGIAAGKTAFVMTNEGEQPHHMSIVRFKADVTEEQVRATIDAGEDVQQHFESEVGESTDAAPGETAVVNAELEPGLYGMACFVEGEDGVPHFFQGMYALFQVS